VKESSAIKKLNTVDNIYATQLQIPSEATVTKLQSWNEWKSKK